MSFYQKGVWPVVQTQTLPLGKYDDPFFDIPKEPNWYMRIHYLPFGTYRYDDYYIRVDYSVVATYA